MPWWHLTSQALDLHNSRNLQWFGTHRMFWLGLNFATAKHTCSIAWPGVPKLSFLIEKTHSDSTSDLSEILFQEAGRPFTSGGDWDACSVCTSSSSLRSLRALSHHLSDTSVHPPWGGWSACCSGVPVLPWEASWSWQIKPFSSLGEEVSQRNPIRARMVWGMGMGLMPLLCSQKKTDIYFRKEKTQPQILEWVFSNLCVLWIPLLREKVYEFLPIQFNMANSPKSLELMGRLEQPWIRHQWGNVSEFC